jgi:hypothetical protein
MENLSDYIKDLTGEMKNRNYSYRTIKIYTSKLSGFLQFSQETKFEPLTRISKYLETIAGEESRRHSYMAIRLFYKLVLNKNCPYGRCKNQEKNSCHIDKK